MSERAPVPEPGGSRDLPLLAVGSSIGLDSPSPLPQYPRRAHRKSRTGCTTCKARKVKVSSTYIRISLCLPSDTYPSATKGTQPVLTALPMASIAPFSWASHQPLPSVSPGLAPEPRKHTHLHTSHPQAPSPVSPYPQQQVLLTWNMTTFPCSNSNSSTTSPPKPTQPSPPTQAYAISGA